MILTKDLTGAALAYVVGTVAHSHADHEQLLRDTRRGIWAPHELWEQGGPIIEQEQIDLMSTNRATGKAWIASTHMPWWRGPTPLIAAMRCYVAHKLGDEVDVPEELL
jgi:hypothetical protein